LEQFCDQFSIRPYVNFAGQVAAGAEVRRHLDGADLFVMPSRQEGLPRAMVEAMARALPCIGSSVGGIPELLPREDMVPPNDPRALARTISDVVSDNGRMCGMAQASWRRAQDFGESVLRAKRREFYEYVKRATQEWFDVGKAAYKTTSLGCRSAHTTAQGWS
jgi:glycosyltransferase involved in cell wall biosynthesis